jgi:hypothetical protein
MKKNKPSIDNLNRLLREAAIKLDRAALEIRDIPFEPRKQHIRKIAEALSNVFDIQHMIYDERPDLEPEYLKRSEPPANSEANRAWGDALIKVFDHEEVGDIDGAILVWESFINTNPPREYLDEATSSLKRLKRIYKKKKDT